MGDKERGVTSLAESVMGATDKDLYNWTSLLVGTMADIDGPYHLTFMSIKLFHFPIASCELEANVTVSTNR